VNTSTDFEVSLSPLALINIIEFGNLNKRGQVKVFDQFLDVLYQNLFFGATTLSL